MRALQVLIMSCGLGIVSASGVALAAQVVGGNAGDGDDGNETTFHFDAGNMNYQMIRPDETPLTIPGVPGAYGTAMQIFNNSVDHIIALGLGVQGADLSGTNWTNPAFPAQGSVAIDPATGRFKFPAAFWQGADLIDAGSGQNAESPQIAINDSGKAFCVFQQSDGSNTRVYANEYIPGEDWQGAGLIDAGAGQTAYDPQIAINDSGKAFCVFRQNDGSNYRVYANEYIPGEDWQGAVLIDAGAGKNTGSPQIVINSSGKAFCVFYQHDGYENRIYANEYVPGAGWQGAGLIDAGAGDNAFYPQIAVNDSGKAFCVFQQSDGSIYRVYANEYIPGEDWQGAVLIDAGAGNPAYFPEIAINDSGKAFCVFRQEDGSNKRVYANEYVPGEDWQGAVVIDAGAGNDAYVPQIAINDSGKAFCVFRQYDGSIYRVYANEYIPGEDWQGAVVIDAGTGNSPLDPQIAINSSGKAFCVFYQRDESSNRIYANEYIPDTGWQGADLIDAGIGNYASDPQIAINDSGKAFCVFREQDGSNFRIYANSYITEIPHGSVQVDYYKLSTPDPTPGSTPAITAAAVEITNRRIEPLKGGQINLRLVLAQAGRVRLKIYNLQGELVKILKDQDYDPGTYLLEWGGENDTGAIVASGVYIIHVQAPEITKIRKVVVIK